MPIEEGSDAGSVVDGRATAIEAAILTHDGQGAVARDRFRSLGTDDRRALLRFLRAL